MGGQILDGQDGQIHGWLGLSDDFFRFGIKGKGNKSKNK